jgi:hypothetical protein
VFTNEVIASSKQGLRPAGEAAWPRSPRALARAVLATLVGACVHVYLQVQMLLSLPNFSFHSFKLFFSADQLSYLGIAINVAQGRSGSTEPFTGTGVSYYPRLYYVVMGLLSRISGIDPVVMWWLLGLVLQFVLACFIGWALYVTTRRWWAATLAPLPFLIGTFAGVLHGSYMARTPYNAPLWGPFALIFPLNGGTAGVSLAACAVLGLLIAGWQGFRPRPTLLAGIFAAICLGVVGNMQTYSFIGMCYVLIYSTALYGLQSQTARRRWPLPVASAALLAVILLAGVTLAAHTGPLSLFVLGLVPALPGYLVVCRLTSWRLLWVTLLGVLVSLPTTVQTLLGLADKDPFLVYRQASTGKVGTLGVPIITFVEHGAVAILLLLILMFVPHPKSKLIRSYALGALLAWSLLSFNDLWGPDQEPYRFWIDEFVLVLVTGFPLIAGVAVGALEQARRRPRALLAALTVLSLSIWISAAVLSAKDWLVFNGAARTAGVSWWPSSRSAAIDSVVSRMTPDGIVVSDTCTDPLSLKAITGARVALYNTGLAWPEHRLQISAVQSQRRQGKLDTAVALKGGVDYLLTDSHCAMPRGTRGKVQPAGSSTYLDQHGKQATVRLWKILA